MAKACNLFPCLVKEKKEKTWEGDSPKLLSSN